MSNPYILIKDFSGNPSETLDFTDSFAMLTFGNPSWVAQDLYVPTSHQRYVVEINAVPLTQMPSGIPNIVAKIRYYPDPNGSMLSYSIYNGGSMFKKVAGGSRLIVDIPRNTGQPTAIDPKCNIYFYFYNL